MAVAGTLTPSWRTSESFKKAKPGVEAEHVGQPTAAALLVRRSFLSLSAAAAVEVGWSAVKGGFPMTNDRIIHNGVSMTPDWPAKIEAAQALPTPSVGGRVYPRVWQWATRSKG